MRTIERRFNTIKRKNEYWSDYICLAEAVRGQKFSRRRIYNYFRKLVSKDDYADTDTNALVGFLYQVTKQAEECTFLAENAPGREKKMEMSTSSFSSLSLVLVENTEILV